MYKKIPVYFIQRVPAAVLTRNPMTMFKLWLECSFSMHILKSTRQFTFWGRRSEYGMSPNLEYCVAPRHSIPYKGQNQIVCILIKKLILTDLFENIYRLLPSKKISWCWTISSSFFFYTAYFLKYNKISRHSPFIKSHFKIKAVGNSPKVGK